MMTITRGDDDASDQAKVSPLG